MCIYQAGKEEQKPSDESLSVQKEKKIETAETFDIMEETPTGQKGKTKMEETGEINITEEPASTEPEEAKPVLLVGGFEDMDYALFLETDVGYGVTGDYFKYGIYGDFTETIKDGEDIYFLLNEKLTDNKAKASSHREWYHYSGEKIVSVSSDLEWVVCREFEGESGWYHEIWYRNRKAEKTFEGNIYSDMRRFVPCKTETGGYEPIPDQILDNVEEMLDELYKSFGTFSGGFDEGSRDTKCICFDDSGTLLAVRELKEKSSSDNVPERIYSLHEENCIRIYDTSKEQIEMLYELTLPEMEITWPIGISQIVGTKAEGWLVFSAGDTTYRMNYPDGSVEKLGEFMYSTTFSPDGRYMAYCTGSAEVYYCWEYTEMEEVDWNLYNEMRGRWDCIAPGWYVEDLETGKITYIPIETWEPDSAPLYGGRCIWIEKDKLLQLLEEHI